MQHSAKKTGNIDDGKVVCIKKNAVSPGDELRIHVKPVEGQSHRLDQADFLSFFPNA